MENNCWLPQRVFFEDYNNDWAKYEEELYKIFVNDFITTRPMFESKQVNIRKKPIEHGKEEAFFHVTCKDYFKNRERVPDFRRCERIKWVKSFIENYQCDPTQCYKCYGVKVWSEPYKSKTRVHLFLEEEKYMVVLERRNRYYLLITAFYLEHEH